ncbi:MAG: type I-E CRISPR-associated endoribonuclease Cas2e [Salinarimonas sp.]
MFGRYGKCTRERIWEQVVTGIGDGNGVIAWSAPNDAGFAFETCGSNRRIPSDFDGFTLVSFLPQTPRESGRQPAGTYQELVGRLFDIEIDW